MLSLSSFQLATWSQRYMAVAERYSAVSRLPHGTNRGDEGHRWDDHRWAFPSGEDRSREISRSQCGRRRCPRVSPESRIEWTEVHPTGREKVFQLPRSTEFESNYRCRSRHIPPRSAD